MVMLLSNCLSMLGWAGERKKKEEICFPCPFSSCFVVLCDSRIEIP